jgi:hypothetical protein
VPNVLAVVASADHCHRLIGNAGFEITGLQHDWLKGSKELSPWNYLYKGVAGKPIH